MNSSPTVDSQDGNLVVSARRKPLPRVPLVTPQQIAYGTRLGLDLKGDSLRVAAARVEDSFQRDFQQEPLLQVTTKQYEFAAQFGYDIRNSSRRVAQAIVGDILEQLDHDTIDAEGLGPGVVVTNKHDPTHREFTISSIRPDLMVFFKGGNGKKAYARSLRRVRP